MSLLRSALLALALVLTPTADASIIDSSPFYDLIPATQTITALDTGTTSLVGANSQTFFVGTTTAGSAAVFTLSSIDSITIEATILGSGGTLEVEVSADGLLWLRPNVFQISTQSYANSFTAPFLATLNVAGMTSVRVRSTVSWSGTATIAVVETVNPRSVTIGDSLPTGSNSIGQVTCNAGTNLNTSALATSSLQTTGNTALATINTTLGTPMQNSGGSVTANAGTNLNTSALATLVNQTNGTQQTKLTDGTNLAAVKAGSTQSALTDDALVVTGRPDNVGTPTQTSVSCAATSTTLLAASTATQFLSIRNPTTSAVTIWINAAGAAAVVGAPSYDLPPGAEADFFAEGSGFLPTSQINCISSGATSSVALMYK